MARPVHLLQARNELPARQKLRCRIFQQRRILLCTLRKNQQADAFPVAYLIKRLQFFPSHFIPQDDGIQGAQQAAVERRLPIYIFGQPDEHRVFEHPLRSTRRIGLQNLLAVDALLPKRAVKAFVFLRRQNASFPRRIERADFPLPFLRRNEARKRAVHFQKLCGLHRPEFSELRLHG